MAKLIDQATLEINNSASILSVEEPKDEHGRIWNRYLCVAGKKAYEIGNTCGTCEFLFERMEGANQKVSANQLSEALGKGVVGIKDPVLDSLRPLLPNGNYTVSLMEVQPRLIALASEDDYFANEQVAVWGVDSFWNLIHSPRIRYYRGISKKVNPHTSIFEFVVPMFPENWLKPDRIAYFEERISKGEKPTAVALSFFDVKEPAVLANEKSEITSHHCLAHFLIDGHHKTYAAAKAGKLITLLSFLMPSFHWQVKIKSRRC